MPRHRSAKKVCALVSGGVESAALLDFLLRRGDEVHPVYVRGGYRWEETELIWLGRLLAAMKVRRLKPLRRLRAPARELCGKSHWGVTGRGVPGPRSADSAVYLPGRNILLLGAASIYAARNSLAALALGTLSGNPFPDASPAFFSRLEGALSSGLGRPIRIETPFRRMTKAQVVERAGGVPFHLTFSCLAPTAGRPCGRCNKCAERRRALVWYKVE